MEKDGMKYFKAVSYDKEIYHFVITPDGEICCIEFGLEYTGDKIEINPNFVLRDKEYRTVYSLDSYFRDNNKKKTNKSLISEWIIPKQVLKYLYDNKKIRYSTIMALVHGFDIDGANDRHHQGRLIKIADEKPEKFARILAPYKTGKFH